jgi:hypothetical protein
MDSIKILIPIHTKPNVVSDTTIFFRNILPELQKKTKVLLVWVVYQPNKLKTIKTNNEMILDLHDYQNFIELLQKEKPDLVYAGATYSLIDYAISTASRFLGIPVLSKMYSRLGIVKSRESMMKSMVTRIFEDHVPSDEQNVEKQFMKRGRFFFYKFRYLCQTIHATKINKIKSLLISLKLLTYFFSIGKHEGYPEFANTAHWLESEKLVQKLTNMGYKKESLVVTGNPMYDNIITRIKEHQKKREEGKIKILFMPLTYYEHGMWTKEQNEYYFHEIVKKLNENQSISLKIKLHPSSHHLEYYKKMIEKINKNIPVFQKGEALNHILDSDIVVSYAGHGTSLVYVLLGKKPLILCNFDEIEDGPILNRKLAVKCTDLEKLDFSIKTILDQNPISEKEIQDFLEEFFYKLDGKASERVTNLIMNLVIKK